MMCLCMSCVRRVCVHRGLGECSVCVVWRCDVERSVQRAALFPNARDRERHARRDRGSSHRAWRQAGAESDMRARDDINAKKTHNNHSIATVTTFTTRAHTRPGLHRLGPRPSALAWSGRLRLRLEGTLVLDQCLPVTSLHARHERGLVRQARIHGAPTRIPARTVEQPGYGPSPRKCSLGASASNVSQYADAEAAEPSNGEGGT